MRDPNLRMLSNVCCYLEVCLRSDLDFDREMVRKTLNHLMELSVSYKVNKMVEKAAGHTASRTAGHTASHAASRTASPKEKENEKENLPPTPPIREKEKEKESHHHHRPARACARGKSDRPTFEQVEAFAATIGTPVEWAKSWFDQMVRVNEWRHPKNNKPIVNWKRYFQIYWKRRKEFDPLPPVEKREEKPRVYTAEDWILCKERCKFFNGDKCACKHHILVPPGVRQPPAPPEECPKYKPLNQ